MTCMEVYSARLRLADENVTKKLEEKLEILRCRVPCPRTAHLHISISIQRAVSLAGICLTVVLYTLLGNCDWRG